jgi:hypothetical protein
MTRSLQPLLLLLCLIGVAGSAPPPPEQDIARLIQKLGSPDFQDRESASKQLEQFGAEALEALREASKSGDPEVVQRARLAYRSIEQRLANEKRLAPTLVELDCRDMALDAVLADLSKQSKYEVVLGGVAAEELARKKVTISTGGKLPFWKAVLEVSDTAGLQIAGASGTLAPGGKPYLGKRKPGLRTTGDLNRAVILEQRQGKARPAAVRGAVLVEAVPLPANATAGDHPSTLLQIWPEPRLEWQATSRAFVSKAVDANGKSIAADYTVAGAAATENRAGVTLVRNPDGSVTVVRDTAAETSGRFAPNPRQAVLHFRNAERSAEGIKQLDVSILATIRTGIEPLSVATGLVKNQSATGSGSSDVVLKVRYEKESNGKLWARVELRYPSVRVHPVGASDDLPGVRGGVNAGYGNHTVYGVRFTDAAGKPFGLGLSNGSSTITPVSRTNVVECTLELIRGSKETGDPAVATFWGTDYREIEIAATFTDVPLQLPGK